MNLELHYLASCTCAPLVPLQTEVQDKLYSGATGARHRPEAFSRYRREGIGPIADIDIDNNSQLCSAPPYRDRNEGDGAYGMSTIRYAVMHVK